MGIYLRSKGALFLTTIPRSLFECRRRFLEARPRSAGTAQTSARGPLASFAPRNGQFGKLKGLMQVLAWLTNQAAYLIRIGVTRSFSKAEPTRRLAQCQLICKCDKKFRYSKGVLLEAKVSRTRPERQGGPAGPCRRLRVSHLELLVD